MIPTLRTERLTLRPPVIADAPAIAAGLSDFEVVRYLTPIPFPYGEADAVRWLQDLQASGSKRPVFAVEHPEAGVIGAISLVDELGYWLAKAFWGRGYATEGARAVLAWHFDDPAAGEVASSAHYDNARSLAVLRRLGFVPVGSSMRFVRSQQRDIEHIEMRLTREAFLAQAGGRR